MPLDYDQCLSLLKSNKPQEAKKLLFQSPINLEEVEKNSVLLFQCVESEYTDVIEVLLDQGLSINIQKKSEGNALYKALKLPENKRWRMVAYLLRKGINFKYEGNFHPLSFAASLLDLVCIKLFLSHGAVPDVKDTVQHTPMHYVAYFAIERDSLIMKDLVEVLETAISSTFFTEKNCVGKTPFDLVKENCIHIDRLLCFAQHALKCGREAEAEALLRRVSYLDQSVNPLFIIAKNFSVALLKKFLELSSLSVRDEKGKEIRSEDGKTLMHFAVSNNNSVEMFRFLRFSLKCSLNEKDKNGFTPLHKAILKENYSILYWFVGLTEVDFRNWFGYIKKDVDKKLRKNLLNDDSEWQRAVYDNAAEWQRARFALSRFFRKHYQEKGLHWAMQRFVNVTVFKEELVKILEEEIIKYKALGQIKNAKHFIKALMFVDFDDSCNSLEIIQRHGKAKELIEYCCTLMNNDEASKRNQARITIIEGLVAGNFILQDNCYHQLIKLCQEHLQDFTEDQALNYALFSYLRAFQALDLLDECEKDGREADAQLRKRIWGYLIDDHCPSIAKLAQINWSKEAKQLDIIRQVCKVVTVCSEITEKSSAQTELKIKELFNSLLPYIKQLMPLGSQDLPRLRI